MIKWLYILNEGKIMIVYRSPLKDYIVSAYVRGRHDGTIIKEAKKRFNITDKKAYKVLSLIKACYTMQEINELYIF
jgi:hypothetical protein